MSYPGVQVSELGPLSIAETYLLTEQTAVWIHNREYPFLRHMLPLWAAIGNNPEAKGWGLVALVKGSPRPFLWPPDPILDLNYDMKGRTWWSWHYTTDQHPDRPRLLGAQFHWTRIRRFLSLLGVIDHSREEEWFP